MADEEDGPPPLEDMSGFLQRLRVNVAKDKNRISERKEAKAVKRDKASLLDNSFSHPAAKLLGLDAAGPKGEKNEETGSVSSKDKESKDDFLKPLKRGFFNAAPACKKEIPFIKPNTNTKPSKKDIPEFMHVESPIDKYREELTSMLKPAQEVVKEVLDNDDIKSGLDDPEIMAADSTRSSGSSWATRWRSNPRK